LSLLFSVILMFWIYICSHRDCDCKLPSLSSSLVSRHGQAPPFTFYFCGFCRLHLSLLLSASYLQSQPIWFFFSGSCLLHGMEELPRASTEKPFVLLCPRCCLMFPHGFVRVFFFMLKACGPSSHAVRPACMFLSVDYFSCDRSFEILCPLFRFFCQSVHSGLHLLLSPAAHPLMLRTLQAPGFLFFTDS